MAEINREYKSDLFAFIFGRAENKKWALSLFNAMNHTQFENLKELQVISIENYLYLGMKNDVALMVKGIMGVIEHQSTYNPNMPVRELMYASRLYDKYIQEKEYNVYSSKRIPLPAPKLVVLYNGIAEKENIVLKLSDSFDPKYQGVSDIEVCVHMYNINYGYNDDLLKQCKPLSEYSWFVERIRYYKNEMKRSTSEEATSIDIAVRNAIEDLPKDFEIRPFLLAHRAEVIGMMFMEYNEEETLRLVGKEKYEDGFSDGRQEGYNDGRQEGISEGKDIGSNEAFKAMDLIRDGVDTVKGLVDLGISEPIAKMALDQALQ
ncbi:MAG: hypothetical protein ILA13_07155 [Eubacterium sp.]|nr:hypothetical protein [Eubacterium sp.]